MFTDQSLSRSRKDPLVAIRVETLAMDAQALARMHGVHHLPVVSHGALVGVVCTCDMLHAPPDTSVRSLMNAPITLSFEHSVEDALELMKECAIGSVVLLEGETPRGIVTRADLGAPFSRGQRDELPRCARCTTISHLRLAAGGELLCVQCASEVHVIRPAAGGYFSTNPSWFALPDQ